MGVGGQGGAWKETTSGKGVRHDLLTFHVSLIALLGRVGPERTSAEGHVGPKARLASVEAAGLRLGWEGGADFEEEKKSVSVARQLGTRSLASDA